MGAGNETDLNHLQLTLNLVPRLPGTRNVHTCTSSVSRSGAEEPGNEAS